MSKRVGMAALTVWAVAMTAAGCGETQETSEQQIPFDSGRIDAAWSPPSDKNTARELADNEKAFIKPIFDKYIGFATTAEQLTNAYAGATAYANTATDLDLGSWYRALCTEAAITAVTKGSSLAPNDPFVQYFTANYSSAEFRRHIDCETPAGIFVKPAPALDCLVAVSLLGDVLPSTKRDEMLADAAHAGRFMMSEYGQSGAVQYYKDRSEIQFGDSKAEESTIAADFLMLASKLLPLSGPGSLGFDPQGRDERQHWYEEARDLEQWSYTKCTGQCAMRGELWMVVNHGIDPHPSYTLSLLQSPSHFVIPLNQLGLAAPSDLFTADLRSAVDNVAGDIASYLTSGFEFTGPFSYVQVSPDHLWSYDYSQMTYTLDGSEKYPIDSSVPTSGIAAMNAYVQYGSNLLEVFMYSGLYRWNYECTIGTSPCRAKDVTRLSNFWATVDIVSVPSNGWAANPPPAQDPDAVSQWYLPNQNVLKSYVIDGDKIWHWTCDPVNACRAHYVQTLQNTWVNVSGWTAAGWDVNPPPNDHVDAFTQVLVPTTGDLKSYIFSGNRMWAYRCNGTCSAMYTQTLDQWYASISGTWSVAPPADRLDDFFAFYLPDGSLKAYTVKDSKIWMYQCAGTCNKGYVSGMADQFKTIDQQFRWPKLAVPGVEQRTGVTDWSFDATAQNDAFASAYLMSPGAYLQRYRLLQAEEIARGRSAGTTPYPVNFQGGAWNYDHLVETKNTNFLRYLTDGWMTWSDMNPNDGIVDVPPLSLDDKINAHWWMNMIIALNHLFAYLSLTPDKVLHTFDLPVAFGCIRAADGNTAFSNTSFAVQTGSFTAAFSVTPRLASPVSETVRGTTLLGGLPGGGVVVGLSQGPASAYTDLAAIVRLNGDAGNVFEARKGNVYTADQRVEYQTGTTYVVTMAVDVPSRTYSVYITLPGGGLQTLASGYPFRTEQAQVASLGNWSTQTPGFSGYVDTCRFQTRTPSTP